MPARRKGKEQEHGFDNLTCAVRAEEPVDQKERAASAVALRSSKQSYCIIMPKLETGDSIMITGIHTIRYATDATDAWAFFEDVLGSSNVDAGDGWLIFAVPPSELAAHPTDEPAQAGRHELYLMCDDGHQAVAELEQKGVKFTQQVSDRGWGLLTMLQLPGAGEIGLYQPRHAVPRRT